MTPEQKARQNIDKQLTAAGWVVQDYKAFNPGANLGIAVREYPTDTGPADYMLIIERKPVGVIEAKPEGVILTPIEEQSERYATSKIKWRIDEGILPFVYESTGVETRFTDNRDPKPRSKEVFTFHKPETFADWLKEEKSLRGRLHDLPLLTHDGLRLCQSRAIENLEKSFKENRPRALIQMATGSGKTYTAITSVYRLLKHSKAKRVLFLVDTRNLGKQAEQEFQAYTPQDDNRKFIELYNVQRLSSGFVDPDAQVCISTIQRMYSILRGEELDESLEENPLTEAQVKNGRPKEVVYNAKYPVEFFDFIVIDECHRSIYNLWKQVLDYYDAFLVGLTATPDARTYGFFKQNVVSEYSHEDAVADGVNVGYDVYTIETAITKQGSKLDANEWVDKRSRMTREKRWEQLDEDVEYAAEELDRNVVNESQIRTIVKTFKNKIPEIFPGRTEAPKTLVFAKTDTHADDIVRIVREEFAEGNEFCKKITYNTENPSQTLQDFRNAYNPRIAVTVDMIATGTDVKAIECLLFMRDVKSKNYFEQMKGRGTRTLNQGDLRKVSPSASSAKTHFVIIDAVGVSKSLKTASRPLERKPSATLKNLMIQTVMGARDEDTLTSLANRLARLDRELTDTEKERLHETAGGKTLSEIVHGLFDAHNPDKQDERAVKAAGTAEKVTEEIKKQAQEELINEACFPFDNPKFRELVDTIRREHDQIIDSVNLDEVMFAGFDEESKEKAKATVETFKEFLEKNKDEIAALQIFYSQPYQRRKLTFKMIKELAESLKQPPYSLSPERVWLAYKAIEGDKVKGENERKTLTDIVSLVRHAVGADEELKPYQAIVEERFQTWLDRIQKERELTKEQIEWLTMIKEHIATSLEVDKESFDLSPFYERGGLLKLHQLFGDEYQTIIENLNKELVG